MNRQSGTGPQRGSAWVGAAALACAIATFGWTSGTVSGQSPARSVWDRVFSAEQAGRGEALYLDECSRCHLENLAGGDFGPPVVGAEFWSQWNGKGLDEVFLRIRDTMPQDNPGRLSAQQTANLVAFLMKSNGFPDGPVPLEGDVATLKGITVVPAH